MVAAPPSTPVLSAAMAERAGARTAFDSAGLLDWLEAAEPPEIDRLPFGVIVMARDTTVAQYSLTESRFSGLSPAQVVGRRFFSAIGPCMNNRLVAERFAAEALDTVLDYALTFKIKPVKVRLRMLKDARARHMYLAVANRPS